MPHDEIMRQGCILIYTDNKYMCKTIAHTQTYYTYKRVRRHSKNKKTTHSITHSIHRFVIGMLLGRVGIEDMLAFSKQDTIYKLILV